MVEKSDTYKTIQTKTSLGFIHSYVEYYSKGTLPNALRALKLAY